MENGWQALDSVPWGEMRGPLMLNLTAWTISCLVSPFYRLMFGGWIPPGMCFPKIDQAVCPSRYNADWPAISWAWQSRRDECFYAWVLRPEQHERSTELFAGPYWIMRKSRAYPHTAMTTSSIWTRHHVLIKYTHILIANTHGIIWNDALLVILTQRSTNHACMHVQISGSGFLFSRQIDSLPSSPARIWRQSYIHAHTNRAQAEWMRECRSSHSWCRMPSISIGGAPGSIWQLARRGSR